MLSSIPDNLKSTVSGLWTNAPDWAKWHAFDRDGQGYYFSAKPMAGGFQWRVINNITDRYAPSILILQQKDKWKHSLRAKI